MKSDPIRLNNLKTRDKFDPRNRPRIAKARAAALFTRGSGATVKRKRSSRKLSEVTRIRRFSKQKAKFPTANKANLCT
jgi:hypothetical protein